MTRADCIRELLAEYQAQRNQNEKEQDERLVRAASVDPEILRLREENAALAIDTMKKLAAIGDEAARRSIAEGMKQRGIFNNARIRDRLKKAGFPEDYLNLRYRCALCRDTGYVGDAPSRFCECFESRLRLKQYEDGSMADAREQRFETFDENRIPVENGQRERLMLVRRACEDYADSYPKTRFQNLLLTGAGGLGKTFLLNCIFARVVDRGFGAVRITAFRLFEAMRRQHFGNGDDDFNQLVEAPLLLIDDLGTEPMMRNITVEYLFTLMNERNAAGRHTVIATNLSPVQLRETYGERVSSRLLDRSHCAAMMLEGKDLRLL